MKRYRLILVIACLSLVCCKKGFLEIEPKSKLIARLTTDYDNLLNNVFLMNTYLEDMVPLSDDVAALDTYFNTAPFKVQQLFKWVSDPYIDDQVDAQFVLVKQIYTFNKIINEVQGSLDGTAESKLAIQSEARAGRAWCYLMLINFYGKPYNSTTAATDPGFPIITQANAAATSFSRASVQEVYDFIIKDLTESIPSIPLNPPARLRVSRAAGECILAKTYVFMGDFVKAQSLFERALSHLPNSFAVKFYDLNVSTSQGSPISNTESLLARFSSNGYQNYENTLLVTPKVAALFSPSDKRLAYYTLDNTGDEPEFGPSKTLRRTGYSANTMWGITLPDIYLLMAECYARNGKLDKANEVLQTFREKRMPATVAAVNYTDKTALIKLIIDERKKEFAVQGLRWFDMRRLSSDSIFAGENAVHYVYRADGTVVSTYTMDAKRLTVRFSPQVMRLNPGMENNP
ncbi:RagB/SusD family nutrient uptake outer membrane protein [Pedobacter sp. MR22-3]|uniref:RagB/SusD family nutrient uptake outer membrane protein n=1 Tax=Pedobacter sp. MR22-3 TaxID=2994552 RepID=UPI00224805BA|nr:RagB/SusD family nutrient uptake outer membrane protein [Pedobacter sp. MR22-3]MCX2584389.1 RagB/SusD family nutrient uptake outer membrane protein [Pedobacter sp. MR22-3]